MLCCILAWGKRSHYLLFIFSHKWGVSFMLLNVPLYVAFPSEVGPLPASGRALAGDCGVRQLWPGRDVVAYTTTTRACQEPVLAPNAHAA